MSAPALNPLNVRVTIIEPTWRHALQVWWSWQWRILVFAILIGLMIPALGAFLSAIGLTGSAVSIIFRIVCGALSVLVSLYIFKDLLDSDFSKFRVCIIAKDLPPQ